MRVVCPECNGIQDAEQVPGERPGIVRLGEHPRDTGKRSRCDGSGMKINSSTRNTITTPIDIAAGASSGDRIRNPAGVARKRRPRKQDQERPPR